MCHFPLLPSLGPCRAVRSFQAFRVYFRVDFFPGYVGFPSPSFSLSRTPLFLSCSTPPFSRSRLGRAPSPLWRSRLLVSCGRAVVSILEGHSPDEDQEEGKGEGDTVAYPARRLQQYADNRDGHIPKAGMAPHSCTMYGRAGGAAAGPDMCSQWPHRVFRLSVALTNMWLYMNMATRRIAPSVPGRAVRTSPSVPSPIQLSICSSVHPVSQLLFNRQSI